MPKPFEAGVMVGAMIAATNTSDWFVFQGVLAGATLGALVSKAEWKGRLLRVSASLLVGFIAGGYLAHKLGQTTDNGFRFMGGVVAFLGWGAVVVLEKWFIIIWDRVMAAAADVFEKAARKAANELVQRNTSLGVNPDITDGAAAVYAAVKADQEAAQKALQKTAPDDPQTQNQVSDAVQQNVS